MSRSIRFVFNAKKGRHEQTVYDPVINRYVRGKLSLTAEELKALEQETRRRGGTARYPFEGVAILYEGEAPPDRGANIMRRVRDEDARKSLEAYDSRRRENADARDRLRNDPQLVALLQAEAGRRGALEIDWDEYFRNAGI